MPKSLFGLAQEWSSMAVKSDSMLWNLIPYAVVGSLWLKRNQAIFKDKAVCYQEVWDLHLMRIYWWIKGVWKECPYNLDRFHRDFCNISFKKPICKQRLMSWIPPNIGTLKFNADRASQGNSGPCGVGGVLRDYRNMILGFFSINMGHGWAFEAEVRAILKALIFCQQYNLKEIIIESDSTTAVGWVSIKSNRPWKLLNELNQIDFLMLEVRCLGVFHIYREANSSADKLAKADCNRTNTLWWRSEGT